MSNNSQTYLNIRENREPVAHEWGRPLVPLFALIIGINDYAHWPKLGAAVADAKAMKQYLQEVLQVSESHIDTLYDKKATRKAIIKAFQNLRDNKRINHGDPIVIFYSGHGSERPAPPAWQLNSMIQCLVPQDCGTGHTRPSPDQMPIPDRTIGALIEDIANVKGDNITVIFDCCHSASGTRGHEEGYVPRTVDLDFNIPHTLDDHIWRSRTGDIPVGFAYHGLQSHVLLAACGEKEFAYEYKGRGQFTKALLTMLKSCTVNDLTYTELLTRIHEQKHIKHQHPQCEGSNRHRILFNARVLTGRQVCHPVHVDEGGKYVVSAGLAHGVSQGVELTLYDDRKRELGVVLVDDTCSIEDFETTVTSYVPLAGVSSAKLTRVGKLPVYLDPSENHSSSLKSFLYANRYDTNVQPVEAEQAKLEVAMEHGSVVFKVLDERVKKFGLTRLPHKSTLDSVSHVLSSAAHYYWFLDLAKEHDRKHHEVAVDFYLLNFDYDEFGDPIPYPIEPGLCQKDLNSSVIDFVVYPDAYYGIKLTNNTPWDLYLNVFLFNNSSLSIISYYTQASAGEPEAPLKRGGTFTIGYGPRGTSPFQFMLEKGQDVDVGHLKIFFATRPIDLCDVAQLSPFSNTGARGAIEGDEGRSGGWVGVIKVVTMLLSLRKPTDTWFALDIPVVQRREGVDAAV